MSTLLHQFDLLVQSGKPVGEVIAVTAFFVKVKGLHPITIHSLVLFDDGSQGFVRAITSDYVEIFSMGMQSPKVGAVVVEYKQQLVAGVGSELLGRIISPLGEPLDGKGPITTKADWPIFKDAPSIHEREGLTDLLETGVTVIDSILPIVKGQRLAIIGDMKDGKTALATQIAVHQRQANEVVVYALIAKRQGDIDQLVTMLNKKQVLDRSIVVATTIFDSLVTTYLAPYVACAIGEYFWQEKKQESVVIYDDLTTHAQAYREISLVSGANPGRDSYPGDIFYIHSSLLERAGKLKSTGTTLTALPVVLAAGGDTTAYLPTNIISITDGQWILDATVAKEGIRPSVNTALSVTRVGGRGHTSRQKDVAGRTLVALTAYRQALEFSHFGAELSDVTKEDMRVGDLLKAALTQSPSEQYSLLAQQLLLETILDSTKTTKLPTIDRLKKETEDVAAKLKTADQYDIAADTLHKKYKETER